MFRSFAIQFEIILQTTSYITIQFKDTHLQKKQFPVKSLFGVIITTMMLKT